jgi:transcriptional regulator with XRE-family HTH domain
MAEQAERVGGRISELRQERGWSKAEMARRMEGLTSGNDVSRWEKGQHLPRSDTLEAIASLLDTTVADLYAGPAAERDDRGATPDLLSTLNGDPTERLARIEEVLERMEARQVEALAIVAGIQHDLQARPQRRRRPADGEAESGG